MSTIVVSPHITDAEWEVMRVVWANGRVTSKEIISILKEKMDWKQATIKTLLGRLVEKGVLIQSKKVENLFILPILKRKKP